MSISKSKKDNIRPFVIVIILFVCACILQMIDDHIPDWNISRLISLVAQYIFFGILAYWTVSVINRVSEKNIRIGLATTIVLMSLVLLLKLVKYNVVYNETAERYLWYAYYIPQCLAPVVLLLTVLGMARKACMPLSKVWNLLFIPAILLIILVFTNDIHEQVFSFSEGVHKGNDIYKWEWGYYFILAWIAGLYLANGILLFIKCRISHCRKMAWLPFALFCTCLTCCILREVFNPTFIKMPETVVFSAVIVCESLIRIGFIPSNTEHAKFFDMADVSAIIADKNFDIRLSSKNAPKITREQAILAFKNGEISLTRDLTLKAKPITGGEVLWLEDSSVINRINDRLAEINSTLAEEIDLITAENQLKEQRSKIEEQNNLYKEIFNIAKPHFKKIEECFESATTDEEKDDALRLAVVYGVFLKRRSNLTLMKNDGKIALSELVYSLRESADALTFCNVYSSVFSNCDGDFYAEQVELIFEFFEECIECALPNLSACLVRLSDENDKISCRIALDNIKNAISENWNKVECEKLGASLTVIISDETIYATLTLQKNEVIL